MDSIYTYIIKINPKTRYLTEATVTERSAIRHDSKDCLDFIRSRYNVSNITKEIFNKFIDDLNNGKVQFYSIGLFPR